jgi:hypothetical protein
MHRVGLFLLLFVAGLSWVYPRGLQPPIGGKKAYVKIDSLYYYSVYGMKERRAPATLLQWKKTSDSTLNAIREWDDRKEKYISSLDTPLNQEEINKTLDSFNKVIFELDTSGLMLYERIEALKRELPRLKESYMKELKQWVTLAAKQKGYLHLRFIKHGQVVKAKDGVNITRELLEQLDE